MDKGEFLLLIPGIIYGVGIVDLLKVMRKSMYWELTAWGVILFIDIVVVWYLFYNTISVISHSLGLYTLAMISPMLFTKACNILTPESEVVDTKAHFLQVKKHVFLLLGITMANNALMQQVIYHDSLNFLRYIAVPLLFGCAYIDKLWVRLLAVAVSAFAFPYIIFIEM